MMKWLPALVIILVFAAGFWAMKRTPRLCMTCRKGEHIYGPYTGACCCRHCRCTAGKVS